LIIYSSSVATFQFLPNIFIDSVQPYGKYRTLYHPRPLNAMSPVTPPKKAAIDN